MVTDEVYFQSMLAAATSLLITGLILASVKTPANVKLHKLRLAKHGLTLAVLVLGILNIVQISMDPNGSTHYLGSCIALAISYVQAMLFTNVVMVLISPEEVTLPRLLKQLGGIAVVDGVLFGAYILLPLNNFFYVYELCILLYVSLLVVYTLWYLRNHRQFMEKIATYYEEEETERSLRWLSVLFWMALAVGILSMLMLMGHRDIDACLTVLIAVFYAFLTACFINYQLSTPIIIPALTARQDAGEQQAESEPHPDRLITWIEHGGYLDTQKAVEDIANELDMSLEQFHIYFSKVAGEDFRTWRVRKRIEHARQLMDEHPDWPVTHVARASGFNDRSWFYQQFLRFTGQSVTDYKKAASSKTASADAASPKRPGE